MKKLLLPSLMFLFIFCSCTKQRTSDKLISHGSLSVYSSEGTSYGNIRFLGDTALVWNTTGTDEYGAKIRRSRFGKITGRSEHDISFSLFENEELINYLSISNIKKTSKGRFTATRWIHRNCDDCDFSAGLILIAD